MEQISLYLAKFTKIVPKESLVRDSLTEILMRHIGAPISPSTIHLKGNMVFVDASPMIKNILFMHKEDVLKELKEKLLKNSISDIR